MIFWIIIGVLILGLLAFAFMRDRRARLAGRGRRIGVRRAPKSQDPLVVSIEERLHGPKDGGPTL